LSPAYRDSLLKRLKPVVLQVGDVVYSAEETPRHAHFVTSGIVSVVSNMASGVSAEVGIWGREGLVQCFHLLGKARIPNDSFVQMAGTALVMPFRDLQEEFRSNEEMKSAVLLCVQSHGFIVGQLAACNRLHEAEQRLARWLLMVRDRIEGSDYRLTQEFLADMLGARRTTVTAAAGDMQKRGLIRYSRGRIQITDSDGLERVACECYGIIKKLYADYYAEV
jgi:CRP-like cAMP-binding protein